MSRVLQRLLGYGPPPNTYRAWGQDPMVYWQGWEMLPRTLPDWEIEPFGWGGFVRAEGDAVIIAVDFEVHCIPEWARRTRHGVTEIGIAVLDTRHVQGCEAGDKGYEWFPKIQSYHWLVEDNIHIPAHCYNKQRVVRHRGNPSAFLFHQSEWVSLDILQHEFNTFLDQALVDHQGPLGAMRNLVTVAFNDRHERKMCAELGLNLFCHPMLLDCINVQRHLHLGKHLQRNLNASHLPNFYEYTTAIGLAVAELHNAGNDATFEMQALIATALMTPAQHASLGGEPWPMMPSWYHPWIQQDPLPPYEGPYMPRYLWCWYKYLSYWQKETYGHILYEPANQPVVGDEAADEQTAQVVVDQTPIAEQSQPQQPQQQQNQQQVQQQVQRPKRQNQRQRRQQHQQAQQLDQNPQQRHHQGARVTDTGPNTTQSRRKSSEQRSAENTNPVKEPERRVITVGRSYASGR